MKCNTEIITTQKINTNNENIKLDTSYSIVSDTGVRYLLTESIFSQEAFKSLLTENKLYVPTEKPTFDIQYTDYYINVNLDKLNAVLTFFRSPFKNTKRISFTHKQSDQKSSIMSDHIIAEYLKEEDTIIYSDNFKDNLNKYIKNRTILEAKLSSNTLINKWLRDMGSFILDYKSEQDLIYEVLNLITWYDKSIIQDLKTNYRKLLNNEEKLIVDKYGTPLTLIKGKERYTVSNRVLWKFKDDLIFNMIAKDEMFDELKSIADNIKIPLKLFEEKEKQVNYYLKDIK